MSPLYLKFLLFYLLGKEHKILKRKKNCFMSTYFLSDNKKIIVTKNYYRIYVYEEEELTYVYTQHDIRFFNVWFKFFEFLSDEIYLNSLSEVQKIINHKIGTPFKYINKNKILVINKNHGFSDPIGNLFTITKLKITSQKIFNVHGFLMTEDLVDVLLLI